MEYPKISCIMPTGRNRKHFAEQAVHYFNRQDYPNKELIIIDGDSEGYESYMKVPTQDNVEYVKVDMSSSEALLTIGAKRNLACSLATGDIICLNDDDDYYSPQRLSRQVQPILEGKADITGFMLDMVFNLRGWQAWQCSSTLAQEVFRNGIVSGTLMYRKDKAVSFPDKSIGEDADFLRSMILQGARVHPIENNGDFVYIRHNEQNLWPLPPTSYPHMHEWQEVNIAEYLPFEDLMVYDALARGC